MPFKKLDLTTELGQQRHARKLELNRASYAIRRERGLVGTKVVYTPPDDILSTSVVIPKKDLYVVPVLQPRTRPQQCKKCNSTRIYKDEHNDWGCFCGWYDYPENDLPLIRLVRGSHA